ncbi:unnamed protein product [Vitrella brassicaformis CCMP3155]|uniref:S-adenosyl-L-methionine-dependent methyltransferase n=1 Tax=Vitrella brassicaformis (strain CCMP3155) TaxID=1169540 RepID=A0A0G4EG16_VITBC|nr:unnamed protein product [Vitrella brassicaformis CCMP3155]|mmetsp:Transcript_17344/g.41698  ORF Transcript_17344/g.41698 Transcript_17344/m.41698 type:complete len:419 (-) Transcript_17344:1188-2444(-)|eukprot:CEL95471.1 unnamed protein product [Vitrella brassicaformis CCMP3155]
MALLWWEIFIVVFFVLAVLLPAAVIAFKPQWVFFSRGAKKSNAETINLVRTFMTHYSLPLGMDPLHRQLCLAFMDPFVKTVYSLFAILPDPWMVAICRAVDAFPGNTLRYILHAIIGRTHLIDHVVTEGIKRAGLGRCQWVLLGAGYDNRTYRMAPLRQAYQVATFEVDQEPLQQDKLRRLRKCAAVPPSAYEDVKYVTCNFNTERVQDVLLSANYQPGKRTIFLLEGVSMYLTKEGFAQTLAAIKELCPDDCTLTFDYVDERVINAYNGRTDIVDPPTPPLGSPRSVESTTLDEGMSDCEEGAMVVDKKTAASKKEEVASRASTPLTAEERRYGVQYCSVLERNQTPVTFGLDPSRLETQMAEHGYEIVQHWSPDELAQQFLKWPGGKESKHGGEIVSRACTYFYYCTVRPVRGSAV